MMPKQTNSREHGYNKFSCYIQSGQVSEGGVINHVMFIATHDPYKVKISTQLIFQMWPQTPGVLMAPFETLIIGAFAHCII